MEQEPADTIDKTSPQWTVRVGVLDATADHRPRPDCIFRRLAMIAAIPCARWLHNDDADGNTRICRWVRRRSQRSVWQSATLGRPGDGLRQGMLWSGECRLRDVQHDAFVSTLVGGWPFEFQPWSIQQLTGLPHAFLVAGKHQHAVWPVSACHIPVWNIAW